MWGTVSWMGAKLPLQALEEELLQDGVCGGHFVLKVPPPPCRCHK